MSKKHEGAIKQFVLVSEAWYGRAALENADHTNAVVFGFYHPDGGTSGEMVVGWYAIDRPAVPRLEVFDDGWHALAQFKDVIDMMAERDDQNITPKAFCQVLERCGFTDATPRERK